MFSSPIPLSNRKTGCRVSTDMNRSEITLLILCGGEGNRAGGCDKPLLRFKGKTLVEHILVELAPVVGQVLISANRNLDEYRGLGYEVQQDDKPFEGPLAALASCKTHITTPWVLVCPGDNPLVQATMLDALISDYESELAVPDILLVHDRERIQPLYFLGRTSCLPDMSLALGTQRAIMRWMDTLSARHVSIEGSFPNINTAQDLETLESA